MQPELNEVERKFVEALDRYKRAHGITEPTWEHVLEVLTLLGYGPPAPEPGTTAAA